MRNIPFYIARRYFFSSANTNAVNIITSIAVIAILVATAALFVILSVFSGLETMNLKFYSNVNPEIKISPAKGKVLPAIEEVEKQLKNNANVVSFAKVIEEKVYIQHKDFEDIAYLKSVDEQFLKNSRIDTAVFAGRVFHYDAAPKEIIASEGIASRLQLFVDGQIPVKLIMPKPGTNILKREEDAFVSLETYNAGVFFWNDQYDKYIFGPLAVGQTLLNLSPEDAYAIEVKTKGTKDLSYYKKTLAESLGSAYLVQTRKDLDSAFLKVMNIENLIIYLIFTLVIIIACFNLAGTIIIIILDKKEEIKTMFSFGLTRSGVRLIFFYTGLIITAIAMVIGLIIATILGYIQIHYPLVYAGPLIPFPFEFALKNYLIVMLTVMGIGSFVSWLMARQVK